MLQWECCSHQKVIKIITKKVMKEFLKRVEKYHSLTEMKNDTKLVDESLKLDYLVELRSLKDIAEFNEYIKVIPLQEWLLKHNNLNIPIIGYMSHYNIFILTEKGKKFIEEN